MPLYPSSKFLGICSNCMYIYLSTTQSISPPFNLRSFKASCKSQVLLNMLPAYQLDSAFVHYFGGIYFEYDVAHRYL